MQRADLLRLLSKDSHARRFDEGETIVAEGTNPVEGIGFLLSGTARVSQQQGEHSIVLGTIESGHFFGETSLLLQRPRIASVKAADAETVVVFLSSASFRSLASSNFQFLELLTNEAISRIEAVIGSLIRLRVTQPLVIDPSLGPIILENRQKNLQIQQMINNTRSSWIGKDKPLFAQGDRNDGLTHLIVQGVLDVHRKYDAESFRLFSLEPGDLLGYAPIDTTPYKRYSAAPQGEFARVISFDNDLLFRILRTNQELFFFFFRTLITQMVILDDSLRLMAARLAQAPGQKTTEAAILAKFEEPPEPAPEEPEFILPLDLPAADDETSREGPMVQAAVKPQI